MSDTPRTDERIVILEDSQWVNAPFAKQLEDELNEANSEINMLNRKVVLLYERLEEKNKRIKLLQHAGDEMLRDNQDMENLNRWWKAKEVSP
jgi:predicted  nucleic acid-binding Zn-ribbon protein